MLDQAPVASSLAGGCVPEVKLRDGVTKLLEFIKHSIVLKVTSNWKVDSLEDEMMA
ncbi:MAG TPA: hypothetical protein VMU68_05595 [Acidimicrobiales bacterium]|nr:hypothetical protein [Acidimicrobiales bacterium]